MARVTGGGRGAAAAALAIIGLLAGCSSRTGGPAPLVDGGALPEPPSITVTVEPGQTLSRIALVHHVPMQAVAEANHLSPPYRIIAGATLVIPGGGPGGGPGTDDVAGLGPPGAAPALPAAAAVPKEASRPVAPSRPMAVAELPPPKPQTASQKPEAAPQKPEAAPPGHTAAPGHMAAIAPRPVEAAPGRAIPLDRPPSEPRPRHEPAPPTAKAATPAPGKTMAPEPKSATAPRAPASSAPPAPHDKAVAAAPASRGPTSPPAHSGRFLWPVRGHVLEGFGTGPGGTHNDGINIAAPRGAAVEAADGGVVAYAGNELRGYGNLILVKHANGWITAYAHCDMMLVKPGQKVAKGQVIARVGATGNVGQPQLHFELRRGNKPVDPREYLASPPTATAKEGHSS